MQTGAKQCATTLSGQGILQSPVGDVWKKTITIRQIMGKRVMETARVKKATAANLTKTKRRRRKATMTAKARPTKKSDARMPNRAKVARIYS
jgi:flagellar biosynthesis/type III secretory pathway chaperone